MEICVMSSSKLKDKYRFYLEYPSPKERRKATRKNLGKHSGTVIAVVLGDDGQPLSFLTGLGGLCFDAVCAVHKQENSPVVYASVSWDYLREMCLRIAKDKALEIHPNMLHYLLGIERIQEMYGLETY
jgi:hypothetical protein